MQSMQSMQQMQQYVDYAKRPPLDDTDDSLDGDSGGPGVPKRRRVVKTVEIPEGHRSFRISVNGFKQYVVHLSTT